jgi:predicted PurR-regulated permease PerM
VAEFRRRALAVGFGIVALAVVSLLVIIYLPLGRSILWAGALAVLFYPVHRRFLAVTGGRPTTAALLSTIVALAVLFVPALFILLQLLHETQDLWPSVQRTLGPNGFLRIAELLDESPLRPVAHWLFGTDPGAGALAIERGIEEAVNGLRDVIMGRLTAATRSAPSFVISGAITIVTFFFFLRSGPRWTENVKRALPLERQHADHLVGIAGQTVAAVFRGVIVTAAIQAVLAGAGYFVTGAPLPILLAFVTFITALVPFVGPVAVWLPVAIGLIMTGHRFAGAALFVWGTFVVSLVDNFLRPYLIGREMRLPVLWLFLAILGGLKAFGFLGLLLGPATLALFLACYRIYAEERRG